MNIFDKLYLSTSHHVKKRLPKKAKSYARRYVSLIQIGLMLLLGTFFLKFSNQLQFTLFDHTDTTIICIGASIFIIFKNLLTYNGKKHVVLSSTKIKQSTPPYSVIALMAFQILIFLLFIILLKTT
jgi:hypothetical protein